MSTDDTRTVHAIGLDAAQPAPGEEPPTAPRSAASALLPGIADPAHPDPVAEARSLAARLRIVGRDLDAGTVGGLADEVERLRATLAAGQDARRACFVTLERTIEERTAERDEARLRLDEERAFSSRLARRDTQHAADRRAWADEVERLTRERDAARFDATARDTLLAIARSERDAARADAALLRADLAAAHEERAHFVACVEQAEALAAGHLSRVREVEAELVARAGIVEAARVIACSGRTWFSPDDVRALVAAVDALPAPPQAAPEPRVGRWCSDGWECAHTGVGVPYSRFTKHPACGCARPPTEGGR